MQLNLVKTSMKRTRVSGEDIKKVHLKRFLFRRSQPDDRRGGGAAGRRDAPPAL